LIDAQSDEHLWAEIYDRDLSDIFAVQSDIAQQIALALRATLTPDERERIEQEPTENLAAYNSYLLGRFHWNKRTVEGFRTAIEHFRRAIEGDPEYALAYTGIADSYALLASYGAVSPNDVLPAARAAALQAVEIDNSLGEAYASLGLIKLIESDWPGAEAAFQRAIELNPNYATAHHWYAFYFMAVAKLGDALAELERARELDPLSLVITTEVGFPLYLNGQYDRAIEEFRKALVLDRDFALAHAWLGLAYAEQGKFDEAITACREAVALSGRFPLYVAYLAYVNAAAGRSAAAMSLARELEERASSEYISPALFVPIYGELGDTDRALESLERAYRERSWYFVRVKVDPKVAALRSEPRFSSLLEKLGLE
jgi:tetratricopeptide (TPR) repeat protein